MENKINGLKKDLIKIGRLLWDKDLVSARSGNLSCRVDDKTFLLTCHDACLGFLSEQDFVLADLKGKALEGQNPSAEQKLHSEIYAQIPKAGVIIHTHTTYVNSYFSVEDVFTPFTFETKLYIGSVKAIPQTTPAVMEIDPVIESLNKNSLAVLKNHGVVAMGEKLLDAFFLIQTLEEAVKMEHLRRSFGKTDAPKKDAAQISSGKKFQLFSQEQIDNIVALVNSDPQIAKLGKELNVTLTMAVKMDGGEAFRFNFKEGKIADVKKSEDAEFIISGTEAVWRQIFNREIDPFVATTQKKLILKGDFAKLSRWYAPFSRIFELWNQVPIE